MDNFENESAYDWIMRMQGNGIDSWSKYWDAIREGNEEAANEAYYNKVGEWDS